MEREKLIAYSIKYEGEYSKISNAISNKEDIEPVICDNCITIFDENYPKKLLELKQPPFVLYYKGNLDLLNKDCYAVVGTRNPCEYSMKATKDFVNRNNDKVIISGLAKGIDTIAHKNAKDTIAVLGCGIDYIYPLENKELFSTIEIHGLLLSEYPANTKPVSYHFPFRNRLIACLSDCVYAMEVNKYSGTMGTINYALELGRNIKVLPFSIYDEIEGVNSNKDIYNNTLINEGASSITSDELFQKNDIDIDYSIYLKDKLDNTLNIINQFNKESFINGTTNKNNEKGYEK